MATKKTAKTSTVSIEKAVVPAPKKTATASRTKKHTKAAVPATENIVTTGVATPLANVPAEVELVNEAPRNPVVSKPTTEVTEEAISRLAYQLYLERGGRNGSPADDWFRAEQILRSGLTN